MAETIIKKLEKNKANVKEALRLCMDKEDAAELKIKLLALREVSEYVDSYEWLTRADAKERMQTIRAFNYDYEEAGSFLGESVGSLKVFVSYCNKRLSEKVGSNTIDLIMDGYAKEALVQFKTLRGTFTREALVMDEVKELLPNPEFKPVALKSCIKELRFLQTYSKAGMEREFEELDKRKLLFLMYILEANAPKYSKDKYEMVKMLTGNQSIEEYLYGIDAREN